MNSKLRVKLQRISQRQQNRIWLNRVIRHLPPLFWFSASILFIGGGIHQLILPLNSALTTSIAFIPSLLVLGWLSLRQKPTILEGATQVDKLLRANSLFVSSWEIMHSETEVKGTAILLLKRCEAALPEWSRSFQQSPQKNLGPGALSAITLSFLGLFLLMQPSHIQIRLTPVAAPGNDVVSIIEHQTDTARILGTLLKQSIEPPTQPLKIGARNAEQNNSTDAAEVSTSPAGDESRVLETTRDITMVEKQPANLGFNPATATAGIQPAAGSRKREKNASHSPGDETAEATTLTISQANEFVQIQQIDIHTGSDSNSVASDGLARGTELIASKPSQNALTQTENNFFGEIADTGLNTFLSAQQRNRVWRYFKQLDEIDESKDWAN